MTLNVLQTVTEVCNRLAIPAPNTVVGSQDLQIIQLRSFMNEEGQEQNKRYPWQSSQLDYTFNSTAVQLQGNLTDLFGVSENLNYIYNQTMWNRTIRLPIFGPNSPDKRQAREALPLTGPYTEYWIAGNNLYFNPAPNAAGQTIALTLVTKNWLTNQNGTTMYSVVTNDTDTINLDETLVIMGIIWRWKAAKQLDYGEDFNKYERSMADAMSRDGTKPVLSLDAGELNNTVQPVVVIPSGGWNLI